MRKIRTLLLAITLAMASGCEADLGEKDSSTIISNVETNTEMPYTLELVADELNVPWEMVMAADGRMFITERPGVIRVIEQGQLKKEPLISFEAPFVSEGEGGLLGLALDPDFTTNHYMYVYHTYTQEGQTNNRVLRLIENNNKAQLDKILIANLPGASNHNGGRIKIGPDKMLYITAGDRHEPSLAQDLNSTGGKILRIGLDGSIPTDNPFKNSPVYSWGHRNPQGLAWHPETGKLYSVEHGQSAHDEINLIVPGGNYGWPLIEGDEKKADLIKPLLHSGDETWAPSGMTFVTQGPWKGSLLVAGLRGEQLLKLTLEGPAYDTVADVQSLFKGQYGRIRNIVETQDGSLYFMTNNRDGRGTPREGDDKLYRLKPKS